MSQEISTSESASIISKPENIEQSDNPEQITEPSSRHSNKEIPRNQKTQSEPDLNNIHAKRSKHKKVRSREHMYANSEVLLNNYSNTPNPIPPFAVADEFSFLKMELYNSEIVKNKNETTPDVPYEFKTDIHQELHNTSMDPFLNSNEVPWGAYVTNIGSHTSYVKTQKYTFIPDSKHTKDGVHNDSEKKNEYRVPNDIEMRSLRSIPEGDENLSSSSSLESSPESLHHYKGFSKRGHKEKNENLIYASTKNIFADLDGSWGGKERLDAVLVGPGMDDLKFKTIKEKQIFKKHLKQLRDIYYSPDKKKEGAKYNSKEKMYTFFKQQYGVKKQRWLPQLKRILFEDRYVPLFFRLFITALCIIALGLASRIFVNCKENVPNTNFPIHQKASTIMAIVVNSVAIVYVLYIAIDEFKGEPLGVRDPLGKLKLILLDLLFLMFSSANLALAFNSMYDSTWVCVGGIPSETVAPKLDYLCRKQKTLSSFLFIILFVWVLTFTVSIVRVVNKVGNYTPRDRINV